jgi:glycosyltransferase involved in cell wall biosynthesis
VLNERDPEHPRAGGAEIHVERIFARLAARGHHVEWLSTGFSGAKATTTHQGIGIRRLGPLPLYYATIAPRVRRIARDEGFDIVVECLNKVPFYSPVYAGIPVLALCHHLFGSVAFDQVAAPIAAGVVLAESGIRRAYRDCPFLAISDSTASDLQERGLTADQIMISPPGIDPPSFDVNPFETRPPRMTYVGRLERYKRIDLMLRAGARLTDRFPELELLVIGKGSEREHLENLAKDLGIEGRTRFTGFVHVRERDALLAGTRVCVFPSEKEGWGLTVIEANALGTPVVARDAPGLRDSIRHDETGLLVPANAKSEVNDYAEAIASLLEEDDKAVALRRRCLEWAQQFDWDRAASDMENAIEVAIGNTSA